MNKYQNSLAETHRINGMHKFHRFHARLNDIARGARPLQSTPRTR